MERTTEIQYSAVQGRVRITVVWERHIFAFDIDPSNQVCGGRLYTYEAKPYRVSPIITTIANLNQNVGNHFLFDNPKYSIMVEMDKAGQIAAATLIIQNAVIDEPMKIEMSEINLEELGE